MTLTIEQNLHSFTHFDDLVAHSFDGFFLQLEHSREIGFFGQFHVGHGFSLLVLQRTIKQDDSGIFDLPPHLGMCDVFVDHDAVEHLGIFDGATRNLLHFGVTLDVDLFATGVLDRNHADRPQRHRTSQGRPFVDLDWS